MKIKLAFLFAAGLSANANAIPVSIVSHQWVSKIVDSRNNVTIRPGSVYEINTYFEEIIDGTKPKFKYIFRDTGLGAADPIYPIFQQGHQESWLQLIPAMWSDNKRHIDHYSKVETPEGCIVHSAYWVRHIDQFSGQWHTEREQGYTLVDIGFDYYESPTPEILCGKHKAHPIVNPEQNPITLLKQYSEDFSSYDSIPEELLSKLETKIALLKLIDEEFSQDKWPRYDDVYSLADNSMWYYTGDIDQYYGQNKAIPQPILNNAKKPSDFYIEADTFLQNEITLSSLISEFDFEKFIQHLNGQPSPFYKQNLEPGDDHFSISQINDSNIYTNGLQMWPIDNINTTIMNPDNYKLVSIIVRPYEKTEVFQNRYTIIPEMRFVFQLQDPETNQFTEQLFIHLMFDGVNRTLKDNQLKQQHKQFLIDYDQSLASPETIRDFVNKYKQSSVNTINYSSSLTGIWVFGSLTRDNHHSKQLTSNKIIRHGVDVGYYSTVWDLSLIRDTIKKTSSPKQKKLLSQSLSNLTTTRYRDPKRHDVEKITFQNTTCAGCHQMGGRDGVHIAMNDNIDPRFQSKTRASEFMIKELARQLEFGQSFW